MESHVDILGAVKDWCEQYAEKKNELVWYLVTVHCAII
jgi:hypothetical protein